MSEAPDPKEPPKIQLLPFLAAGGNEEARRAFIVRYRPRILRWCCRLQADDTEEVASRVPRELGLTLSGVYKARDRVRRLLEEDGQAEPLPSVGIGALP